VAVYTRQGRLGLLGVEEYGRLVARHERRTLLEELQRASARGEEIDDVLRRLAPAKSS
jgi:hypothetical protein